MLKTLKNKIPIAKDARWGFLFCGCKQSEPKQAKKLYAARIFCVLAPKNIDIHIYVWYTDGRRA